MKYLVSALAVVLLAAPAVAANETKDPEATEQAQDDSQNRMICKRQKSTGSRMGGKQVCMTEAQWEQRRLEQRQQVERGQNQRTLKGD